MSDFAHSKRSVRRYCNVKQLPFPDSPSLPPGITLPPEYASSSISDTFFLRTVGAQEKTASLIDSLDRTGGQRSPDTNVGQIFRPVPKSPTTAFYQPVVMPGARGKGRPRAYPRVRPPMPRKLRVMVHLATLCLSLFMVVSVLMIISPVDRDEHVMGVGQFFQPLLHMSPTRDSNTALVWSHVATATAVTQDGYDPGGTFSYSDVNTAPVSSNASDAAYLNRFFVGQCTYWANMRYHQLTGHWVPWLGNADAWAYQALSYGWVVSDRPNPHGYSIIVMQSQVEGAGSYGHVAVVEHTNADDSVYTSNWNWDHGWRKTTYVTFTPQSGVSFIWFP